MVRGTCIWPLRASDCVDVDACVDDEDGPPRADERRILARVQQQVATGGSDSAANVGLSRPVVRLELCRRQMYTQMSIHITCATRLKRRAVVTARFASHTA